MPPSSLGTELEPFEPPESPESTTQSTVMPNTVPPSSLPTESPASQSILSPSNQGYRIAPFRRSQVERNALPVISRSDIGTSEFIGSFLDLRIKGITLNESFHIFIALFENDVPGISTMPEVDALQMIVDCYL